MKLKERIKSKMNPLTLKQFKRFRSVKRGYYSAILFALLLVFCAVAELFVNSRALIVKYEGEYHFPTYGQMISGAAFGEDYLYEANYRDLQKKFEEEGGDNFVLMPIIPYNAYENDLKEGIYPPTAPDAKAGHFCGTDTTGRDVLARVIYGFRVAIIFSISLLIVTYVVGISIGCSMGYFGGKFDLFFQRLIEIWANIPFLYIVVIISSIIKPNLLILIGIMIAFGWHSTTWQFRTQTYKEKAKEYIQAAKSLGASSPRIIFKHIIPNSISLIVTFAPFAVASGINSLTSLDYLGFGLPAPTPSWGELLKMGQENLDSYWIIATVICAMILILTTVTFIGEAVREAFDPKKHTTYE